MAYSAGGRSTGLAIASGVETQSDGSRLIRENLVLNGNLTANTLTFKEKIVVQQSGSTSFGDTDDDTHSFTGSALTLSHSTNSTITADSLAGSLTTAAQPNITSLGSQTALSMDSSAYINWGSTAGSSGIGLRESGGKIQFKHNGGTWTEVGSGTGGGSGVYTEAIGNGSDTSFVVTHDLNTQDLTVMMRETSSPYGMVLAPVGFTSTSTATITFPTAPTSNQYTVTFLKAAFSKVVQVIGNGSDTQFTVTDNFGSRNKVVTIRETSSPYSLVLASTIFEVNSSTITFPSAPTTSQYTVTVLGG